MITFDDTLIDEAKKDKFDSNKKSHPINSGDYIKMLRKMGYNTPAGTAKNEMMFKMCKLDSNGK